MYKEKKMLYVNALGNEIDVLYRTLECFVFLIQTGLRISEMIDLRVEDIQGVGNKLAIKVLTKKNKGQKHRIIPLTGVAVEILKKHKKLIIRKKQAK